MNDVDNVQTNSSDCIYQNGYLYNPETHCYVDRMFEKFTAASLAEFYSKVAKQEDPTVVEFFTPLGNWKTTRRGPAMGQFTSNWRTIPVDTKGETC